MNEGYYYYSRSANPGNKKEELSESPQEQPKQKNDKPNQLSSQPTDDNQSLKKQSLNLLQLGRIK